MAVQTLTQQWKQPVCCKKGKEARQMRIHTEIPRTSLRRYQSPICHLHTAMLPNKSPDQGTPGESNPNPVSPNAAVIFPEYKPINSFNSGKATQRNAQIKETTQPQGKEVGKQRGSREEEKISASFESINDQRTRIKDKSHDISSRHHKMGDKSWRKLSPMNPKKKINKVVWWHNMKDTQTEEIDKMLFSLMSCFGDINII